MIRRARRDGREAGEMRKGRRERIEKGSREDYKETRKRQLKRRARETPPFIEFSKSDPAM